MIQILQKRDYLVFKKRTVGTVISLALLFIFFTVYASAEKKHEHPKPSLEIGLVEKLGETVPLELTFTDEKGNAVVLKELINEPTIVALVFYRCPDVCPLVLSGVADVLDKLPLKPGEDYSVLTISFDETDTPEGSLRKKRNHLSAIEKPFPKEAWTFLTGDTHNIRQFTDAVGFRFKREKDGFAHPVALTVLSEKGRVIRYLHGVTYLPFDLKMALIEASEGRVGSTIQKVLQFCFSYDPKGRTYVLNVVKISGVVVIFLLTLFFVFLLIKGKRRNT